MFRYRKQSPASGENPRAAGKLPAPDIRKLLFLLAAGTIFFFIPKAYLGDTFPLCLYRALLGLECPGCGVTRAVWSVLHLEFAEALEYNKLIVVVFPLLLGCAAKWTFTGRKAR